MSSPEYITFLSHMRGENGDTRLLAGTRSRLFANTGLDANWRLLYSGAGGVTQYSGVSEVIWKSTQVGNIALFTNGVDQPVWWSYGGPADDANCQHAQLVDDLVALDISAVRAIGSWKGFVFLANVTSEGSVFQNRIYWSDFNDPLSFTPLPDSLAGYIDLGADERVIAMGPLGGQFRVYTDKAIYDANLVGGEEVFNFREVYRGPEAIRFENSLVNLGDSHIYGGEDTLYAISEFDRSPRRLDWLYRASGAIYVGLTPDLLGGVPATSLSAYGPINRKACHLLNGGYDEARRMLWFSWAADDEVVPSHSLVMQMDIGKASVVDAGFTAFCSHLPSYQPSVRRWLSDIGVCPPKPENGEGNPFPVIYHADTSVTCIRNATENPLLPAANDSLCHKFELHPELEPDCSPCGNGYKFIMASAQDKCLKEYDPDFYARQVCTTPETGSSGSPARSGLTWTVDNHPTTTVQYEDRGYISIIQTDAMDMGSPANKTVSRFAVEYDAPDVADPMAAKLHADVGYGAQPRAIVWQGSTARPIDRLSSESEVAMKSKNLRPNRMATYQFFRTGSQIAYRLMIADANKGPVIGGSASLNEMSVTIRASHGDYF